MSHEYKKESNLSTMVALHNALSRHYNFARSKRVRKTGELSFFNSERYVSLCFIDHETLDLDKFTEKVL